MEISAAAQWLNETFANFDLNIFTWVHNTFHEASVESFFNAFFHFVTFLGEKGWFFIVLGAILIMFKKTRKVGTAMLGAVIVGAVITNITVKPLIARPRPYTHTESPFYIWWQNAGQLMESDNSFPSGHTTSAMAAMTGLFLTADKRFSWTAFIFAILMGLSRLFFFVHYPTDVIGGMIVGLVSGVIAVLIVNFIYKTQKIKLCTSYTNFELGKKSKK